MRTFLILALVALGLSLTLSVLAANVPSKDRIFKLPSGWMSESHQEPSSLTPTYPHFVVRDSFLRGNGIGVYVGFGAEGKVAIVNNVFIENAEAVRLLGAVGLIHGNEFRENLIGIKVQKDLVYQGHLVTFEVAASQITENNFRANQEFAVLNLTSVPLDLNDNFWGDARGPMRTDPAKQIVQQAAAVLLLAPNIALTVGFMEANPAVLFYTEFLVMTLTLQTTLSKGLVIPSVLTRSVGVLAVQGERVRGPAALQSWRENPVHVETVTSPSR